jgi:hypothetical protein
VRRSGGVAGSVLTVLACYAAVPAEVDQHNRQVADIDDDLDRYAADEYARLRNVALASLAPEPGIEKMTVQPDLSKVLAHQRNLVVSASMQFYRDEQTARTREHPARTRSSSTSNASSSASRPTSTGGRAPALGV